LKELRAIEVFQLTLANALKAISTYFNQYYLEFGDESVDQSLIARSIFAKLMSLMDLTFIRWIHRISFFLVNKMGRNQHNHVGHQD